jgi:tetratricopeptide (TPR) repeat protein
MKIIIEVLNALSDKISNKQNQYYFDNPVKEEVVEFLEYKYNIELPKSYKSFLLKHNGGFVCRKSLEKVLSQPNGFETARWNSLEIFGTREIIQHYEKLRDQNWKLDWDWKGVYPIIPMGLTDANELLVFINPLDSEDESPVFDAFHEDPTNDWGIISENFTEFLSTFISVDGAMSTIASNSLKTARDFLPECGWKSTHEDSNDLNEVKLYFEKMIEYFPDEGKYIAELANTNRLMGDLETALKNIDLALKMNSYIYFGEYYKSMILADLEQPEAALEYINLAISKHENSSFFKLKRAELNTRSCSFEAAEKELNEIIEVNPEDAYTYYLRGKMYLKKEQFQQALDDLLRSDKLEPGSLLYLTNIAITFHKMKDFRKAIEFSSRVIKSDPDNLEMFMIRENCYRSTGQIDKADDDADTYVEIVNSG